MIHQDIRSLTPEAQEERRPQVIGLRESGLIFKGMAREVRQTRNEVADIRRRYAAQGEAELGTGPLRPAPGTGWFLTAV